MLKDRFKTLLLGGRLSAPGLPVAEVVPLPAPVGGGPAYSRHSHGLDQFFSQIQDQEGLSILDLSGATQANVAFITDLGHRLYSVDFLRTLDETFRDPQGDIFARQSQPDLIEAFLRQNLDFPDKSFDGLLVWGTLEFLAAPLLKRTVERFARTLKPGSHLLAFFHADEKVAAVPTYSYRITDSKTLLLTPRGMRRPAQLFNNRGIERLFEHCRSVKFFLARDHLREVIVTR